MPNSIESSWKACGLPHSLCLKQMTALVFGDDFQAHTDREPQQWNEGIFVSNQVHVVVACLPHQCSDSLVLRRKMTGSTCLAGSIFFGARARVPPGFGAMYVRINHPLNQPGVISSTPPCGRSSSAAQSSGTMISFTALKCSRHWPTLQAPCLGCQFSWEGLRPAATDSARRSAASNSERMRSDHFGKPESPAVDARMGI